MSVNNLARRYAPLRQSSEGLWLHAITALTVLIISAALAAWIDCGYVFYVGLVMAGVFAGASIASLAFRQR